MGELTESQKALLKLMHQRDMERLAALNRTMDARRQARRERMKALGIDTREPGNG